MTETRTCVNLNCRVQTYTAMSMHTALMTCPSCETMGGITQ